MGKWVAGVAATVVGGILVYLFTVVIYPKPVPIPSPQPAPNHQTTKPATKPKVLKGYLLVFKGSDILKVADLKPSDKICTIKSGAEFLRTYSPFSANHVLVLPEGELYPALERNICSSIFLFNRETADKFLPVGITSLHLVPVYE
jgi:hypothetical protein